MSTGVMGKLKYLVCLILCERGQQVFIIDKRRLFSTNLQDQGVAMAGIDFGCDIDVRQHEPTMMVAHD